MDRKEFIITRKIIEKVFIVILLLVITMVLQIFSEDICCYNKENISTLTDGWYYIENEEMIDVTLPQEIQSTQKSLILYNDSLMEKSAGQTIFLKAAKYEPIISYGNSIIYQYIDDKFPRNDQMKSKLYCKGILPVIDDYETLKIEFFNQEGNNYQIPLIYIGKEDIIMLKEMQDSIFPVGIAVIMLALSVFALLSGLYLKKIRIFDVRFWDVAFFLVICSIWCLTDSAMLQQYSRHYHINSTLSFFAFMLLAIPMLHFIRNTECFSKYHILDVLNLLFYINAIVQGILNYCGVSQFVDMLFVTHMLLAIGCVVVTILILKEYRINKTQEIQTIVYAFIILATSGILAMALYWLLKISYYSSIFEVGIIIFVALLLRGIILSAATNIRAKTEIEVLRRLAKEDRLTGIGNRRAFEEYMSELQMDAARLENALLIFIDINYLKSTNDRFGHSAGDELIIAASRCLKNAFGEHGEYFRIGGDEFCVILKNPSMKEEMWYEALENEIRLYNHNSRCRLSVAKGGSYLRESDGKIKTISDWKYQADRKMYEDKSRKRRR